MLNSLGIKKDSRIIMNKAKIKEVKTIYSKKLNKNNKSQKPFFESVMKKLGKRKVY